MLTDVPIRKAKPAEKAYKLTDDSGLHLYVSPAGGKLWRMAFRGLMTGAWSAGSST